MAKLGEMFPSKYLKAEELGNGDVGFTIAEVNQEEVGQEREVKFVAHFKESDKGLVLNKTNAESVFKATGCSDTVDMAGKTIALYATEVEFGGKTMMGIRVRLRPPGDGVQFGLDSEIPV